MFSEAYHPSIFYRTPQEHLECQWRKDIQLPPALPERFVDVLDLQVIAQRLVPRHARVYVFLEWQEGRDDKELIHNMLFLKADVPFEPSGNLSLVRIRAMWGLEKCVVSPLHFPTRSHAGFSTVDRPPSYCSQSIPIGVYHSWLPTKITYLPLLSKSSQTKTAS